MKYFALLFIIGISYIQAFSQPFSINDVFNKYSGRKDFTTVSLSDPSSLFTTENPITMSIEGIKGLKILKFDHKKGTNVKDGMEFFNDLKKIDKLQGYKEFLSVIEDGKNVKIMFKQDGNDISEFITAVANDKDESVLIWINGSLNMNSIMNFGNTIIQQEKESKSSKGSKEKKDNKKDNE